MAKTRSKGSPTTIWDSRGKASTGYISNGATYYDNGQRISEGSKVVDNSGREWTMKNGRGVLTGNRLGIGSVESGAGRYGGNQSGEQGYGTQNFESALRSQHEAQQRAIQEGINNAVAQNEAYIPKVNQSYDDAVRAAYVTREQAQAQTPEVMAAMGASGGASESTLLGLKTNFENSRMQAGQQKQSALDGIMQNSANIRASGNTSLANLGADYQGKLAQALQRQIQQEQEQSNWQKQYDMQNNQYSLQQQQYKDKLSQQAWENALAEKQFNLSASKARNGGSGAVKAYKPSLSAAQAASALTGGLKTPEVLEAHDYYYGTAGGRDINSAIRSALSGDTDVNGDVREYSTLYKQGKINLDQYKALLKKYGYGTNGVDVWVTD